MLMSRLNQHSELQYHTESILCYSFSLISFSFILLLNQVGVVQSSWQADSDEDLTHVQPRRRVPAANNHYLDDYSSKCS